MSIIREPTRAELSGDVTDENSQAFVPILLPEGKVMSVKDKFSERINQEEQKSIKLGKPFAIWAVRAEVKDLQDEFNKKFRRQGYVKDFKIPTLDEIDWKKYSDLKNWELLDESVKKDDNLSKINRLPVFVKYKTYRYTGYSNTYTVMEPEEAAVMRAQSAVDNRKPVEKK